MIEQNLTEKILAENIKVQREEAEVFDSVHPEIFNNYQQKKIVDDIIFIGKLVSSKNPMALDIGAGTGNLSTKFLKSGFSVTAVDISKEMLNVLLTKVATGQIRVVESDIDSFILNENGKYDVIAFSTMLHHLHDYIGTIEKVIPFLNEGGIIYIVHEPAKIIESKHFSLFWKIVRKIDSLMWSIIIPLKRIKMPKVDYTYSDYHENLDSDMIIKILKDRGMEILIYEEYIELRSGILSALVNNIIGNKLKKHAGKLRYFNVIARKRGL